MPNKFNQSPLEKTEDMTKIYIRFIEFDYRRLIDKSANMHEIHSSAWFQEGIFD